MRHPRPPRFRLIIAALMMILTGYYLGQLYQRHMQRADGLEPLVQPPSIRTSARLPLDGHWSLLVAGEADPACEQLLRRFLETVNRLAAWPKVQARIRLYLLASKKPDNESLWHFIPWASALYVGETERLGILQALRLPVSKANTCGPGERLALIGPDRRLYAHMRLDKPTRMAESLRQFMTSREPMTDTPRQAGWLDRLNTQLLRILPQHWLSARMYDLARSETPWLKNSLIRLFRSRYDIDMREAAIEDPLAYRSFNAFFTRALKPGVRPVDPQAVVSPADGILSQAGRIQHDRLIQAKGREYSLYALLAGDGTAASQYESGSFATIYLSPRDYHRVHMPLAGTLREMTFVPGDLFSVSEATTQLVPGLFARNERLILQFDTRRGPMAVILVGAIFVGSMQTVWHGEVRSESIQRWKYEGEKAPRFDKGEEIARFNMGSTVITLHPQYAVDMRLDLIGQHVKMGQAIGD